MYVYSLIAATNLENILLNVEINCDLQFFVKGVTI
jgi:hypothetical protein